MNMASCVSVEGLSHRYGARLALNALNFRVNEGEILGFLGPNGSGKTTLFRILSTAFPPQEGRVEILGLDLQKDYQKIRQLLGVVFQNPSLDKKLTVYENMKHQGRLYGLSGKMLFQRIEEMLERTELTSRRDELVETLSGGLKRRVEIAKALLHSPRILLLDEPSTGLDPGVRRAMWDYLKKLQEQKVTILVTTHLMDEAELCHQLLILHEGNLMASGSPKALKETIGGDVLTLSSPFSEELGQALRERFKVSPQILNGSVRLEIPQGHRMIPQIVEAFVGKITAVHLSKPTLEDVFIHKTGHQFYESAERRTQNAEL